MYPIGLMDNQLTKVDQDGVPLIVQNISPRNDYMYEVTLFNGDMKIISRDQFDTSWSKYYLEMIEDDFAAITKIADKYFRIWTSKYD